MADTLSTTSTAAIPSFIATTSKKIKDLIIKDGQLIFIRDVGRIAFDFKGVRTFYNQIIELDTDEDRANLSEPISGGYYFVIGTAVLWRYDNGWCQLTTPPNEILFIGTEMPELGKQNTLYVNKEKRVLSVWDEETQKFIHVSNYADVLSADDIRALF